MGYNPNFRGKTALINGINLSGTTPPAGSTAIGDNNSYSNFTPSSPTVKAALSAIDAALTGGGGDAISLRGKIIAIDAENPGGGQVLVYNNVSEFWVPQSTLTVPGDVPVFEWQSARVIVWGDGTGSGSMKMNRFANDFATIVKPNDGLAGDTLFQLPINNGTAGYVLSTDGTGITSWVAGGGGGSPGGVSGSIQFNNSGAFDGDANFIWNSASKSIWFGVTNSGGTISTANNGVLVFGQANGGTATISADQIGSLVHGLADSGVLGVGIGAQGSHVFGFAQGGAQIYASAFASHAWGNATNASSEISTEVGALGAEAFGSAISGGIIQAFGEGSEAHGKAVDNGVISTGTTTGEGVASKAFGYVENTSFISSVGIGSLAHGWSTSNFHIRAGGTASHASGIATLTDNLANGMAAFTHGDSSQTTADLGATFGLWNINNTFLTTVVGRYSVTPAAGNEGAWVGTDPLFVVGNGSDDGTRANAFQVNKDGTTVFQSTILPAVLGQAIGTTGTAFGMIYVSQIRDNGGSIVVRPAMRTLESTGGSALNWATVGSILLTDANLSSLASSPPTFTPNAGAGTGATVTDQTTGAKSTDMAGRIRITTGTGVTSGSQATITFAIPFANDTVVNLTPANANAALAFGVSSIYVTAGAASFDIFAGVALTDATDYDFNYFVVGVQ